jgi:hypothetical protein
LMSATQLLSCKACATIRCFRALFGNDLDQVGSMLCNFLPESQQSSQNLVEVPLPTVVCTATPKNVWAIHGTCTGKPAQRRPSSVFCAHSHLIRSDQPKVSRLWMPSPPPNWIGRWTFSHETISHLVNKR